MYNISIGEIMKVIFVIDSISELNNKINMLKTRFGNEILYVVKSNLVELVKTYGINPNGVYKNNYIKVIHILLNYNLGNDIVICYSSIKLNNDLLNKFISRIGDKQKIVNVMPNYSSLENLGNNAYNIYVKSLFGMKDSLASSKLQFLPSAIVPELLATHFGNRLFALDEKLITTIHIEKGELSESLKTKMSFSKFHLIPIIIALVITMGLILSLAFLKVNYIMILIFVFLYVLDILIALIFHFKAKFDKRFMQ